MKAKLDELLNAYRELSELHKTLMDLFILKFSGFQRYDGVSIIENSISRKITYKEFENLLRALVGKNLLLKNEGDYYDVPSSLRLELFPVLVRNEHYVKTVKNWRGHALWGHYAISEVVRDYLLAAFTGDKPLASQAADRLVQNMNEAFRILYEMLELPAYDHVLTYSPDLFSELVSYSLKFHILNLLDWERLSRFLERNSDLGESDYIAKPVKAGILFQEGSLAGAEEIVASMEGHEALLLKAEICLFRGDFESSVAYFSKARVTDADGMKMPRADFSFYDEFFYWLNFLFIPERINHRELNSFFKKAEKNSDFKILSPLLYIIKKDIAFAEREANFIARYTLYPNIISYIFLLEDYAVSGKIREGQDPLVLSLGERLHNNGQWLFLRELIFMAKKSGIDLGALKGCMAGKMEDMSPCLTERLIFHEKWEQMLDGLMHLATEKDLTGSKKKGNASRICYFVNLEKEFIQPVLQTLKANGSWSGGRNIALKRLKEEFIEGSTEQDRRVASSIEVDSGYYGSVSYYFNFSEAIRELCGHPLLFLLSNPSVPVELIKVEPEIITESTKNGILLKTNIPDPDKTVILMKETQTRYKLVTLTPVQQSVIRMINSRVTIPARGKKKLLETVSQLSSVMTVHTDLTEVSGTTETVDPDSRIRVQIIPVGNGLKAEFFIKPLGSDPPYVKPGRGSKVIYGTVDGKNCQTIRALETERANAMSLNNAISEQTEADLSEDAYHFTDPYQCLDLLDVLGKFSAIAVVEWPEGERFRLKKSVSFENFSLRIKGVGQWFELEGEVNVDEKTVLSLKELLAMANGSKGRFLELKTGEFLALTADLKKQIDEIEAYSRIDRKGISINRFASHALEEITSRAGSFKGDKLWKSFQKQIRDTATFEVEVPSTLDAELRPYQEEGFHWMARLNAWGAGACLADDMGLGKTVQAIAMMLHLAEKGPVLVVCPASVVLNWCYELQRFAPVLRPVTLKSGNREETFTILAPFDVLVVTYGLLQSEVKRIAEINWAMAVLDEAQAIKNNHTKSSKAALNIQAGFKLVLTGTPIQNNLGELWNLFNFCNPGLLGTFTQFTDRFIKNASPLQTRHLKKLITPFILRRTKNKVLDELPSKTEITYSVALSEEEMAFYETLRREAVDVLESSNGTNGQQHLQALAEITKLRLACCNTALVNKEIRIPSSKLNAFLEIVEDLVTGNHRALVFSQFVGHLSFVRCELDKLGIKYQYLDGSVPIPEREVAVRAFQKGEGELFLISLKAGGLGLNLTGADYIFHLDPWWNPAIEDQASDRAYRIGQTRPVTIYRLVAKNTIEEKIVKLHATKRELADSLLDETDRSARLSTADLLDLLKEASG